MANHTIQVTLNTHELHLLEEIQNTTFRLYVITKSYAGRGISWRHLSRKMRRDGTQRWSEFRCLNQFEIKVKMQQLWVADLIDLRVTNKNLIEVSFVHDDNRPKTLLTNIGTAWIKRGKDCPVARPPVPKDLREQVWTRDGYTCLFCGSREHLTADHIRPVAHGGETSLKNLQTLCRSCNSRKGAKFSECQP